MRSLSGGVCVFVFALAAFAQGDRGTITGVVSDPVGAIVAGAQVQGRNLETGAIYPATTTTAGVYTLSQLPVGTYEVSETPPVLLQPLRPHRRRPRFRRRRHHDHHQRHEQTLLREDLQGAPHPGSGQALAESKEGDVHYGDGQIRAGRWRPGDRR